MPKFVRRADGLDCYLSFMADAIRDAVGNSIEGDINLVDRFKPDERAPKTGSVSSV